MLPDLLHILLFYTQRYIQLLNKKLKRCNDNACDTVTLPIRAASSANKFALVVQSFVGVSFLLALFSLTAALYGAVRRRDNAITTFE